MSTDSTELTFVRCPSCRSLVPAVSTRCRMCGAALDPATGSAPEPVKSGRVRQRTMSEGTPAESELTEVAEQLRSEQQEPFDAQENDAVDDIPVDDPLSAFIEEVEVEAESTSAIATQPESADDEYEADDDVFHFDESEEDPSDALAEVKSEMSAMQTEEQFSDEGYDDDFESFVEEDLDVSEDEPVFEAKQSEPESKPVKSEPEPVAALKEEPPKPTKKTSKKEESKAGSKESVGDKAGRLFGWLVSYSSPEGDSIELREGKFFVTSNSLKNTDLILDDESVSTPHAMVTVSGQSGFLVQDLMSDRGVFIKHQGADAYEKETEVVRVENGAWIRFGDVEFLVSLIPYVGVK